ncbi:VOC family protein [Myroides marinus]|nr:VOC family protein [Myroides marinus]MDM1389197.1 VOC family protein [Myroides marinus]MDM1503724.1 VOC family protein [Myroides marinus]MDM1531845.1 VOC family protein [Myroides marinus]MDM1538731.1 VOC family protein [Myroides marinus]
MNVKRVVFTSLVSLISFVSCNNLNKTNSKAPIKDTVINSKEKNMRSYIALFEIPASDISRAISFYQTLLEIEIEKIDIDGMQMGIFPYEGQMVPGVIIQAEGYKPSANGVTMYLNAGDDLQVALDKVEKNNGQILVPKTAHADGIGYFAIFLDSEGNQMALNSPN